MLIQFREICTYNRKIRKSVALEKKPNSTSENLTSAADILNDFNASKAGTLTFFVGWLSGTSYQLRRLILHKDIEKIFRDIANDVLEGTENVQGVKGRKSEKWTVEAQIFPETYLECSISSVGNTPRLTSRPKEERLLEVLKSAELLEVIDAKEIDMKRIGLYGFTIAPPKESPGERIVFIRRINPRRGLRGGRIFGQYSDALTRIEGKVFAFDEQVDLIVAGDRLVVLSQSAFIALFRDKEELKALVPKWGKSLSDHFPVEKGSLERIIAKAVRDLRHRQRLEAIVSRGHLEGVELLQLKDAMESCELDPEKFFTESGELCVEEGDVADLLYFLNEDLYLGLITGEKHRADKKATL